MCEIFQNYLIVKKQQQYTQASALIIQISTMVTINKKNLAA